MFMIAPTKQLRLRRDARRDIELVHSPTAMLDQLTPFWPGSFWMAIVQRRSQRARERGTWDEERKWNETEQTLSWTTKYWGNHCTGRRRTCGQAPIIRRLCLRRVRKPRLLFACEPRSDIAFVLVVRRFSLCGVGSPYHRSRLQRAAAAYFCYVV